MLRSLFSLAWFYGECTMIYVAPLCFLCFFISRNKNMQAIKLTRQVKKPIKSENDTPIDCLIFKVRKTLAIYPTSGRIKVKPASFPIQLDDILA